MKRIDDQLEPVGGATLGHDERLFAQHVQAPVKRAEQCVLVRLRRRGDDQRVQFDVLEHGVQTDETCHLVSKARLEFRHACFHRTKAL